ncbi:MAG: MFS transporter [Alphaproteobacteria bacterium]|nr:MFS transporter [Alphaproteobacteria bacterium]
MTGGGGRDGTASAGLVPWLVWSLGALFFCYGFFQRVAPSVMVSDLMRDFEINAAVLGNLLAFYFYAYAVVQLPVGVLVDSWGSRRLLAGGALVCGLGTLLFATAGSLGPAYLGRLLIGGGAGFAFVATLKLAGTWFPPGRFALMSGLTSMLGMTGAVLGQAPVAAAVAEFGWRPTLSATALLGLVLGLAIWLMIRDGPLGRPVRPSRSSGLLHGLGQVARNPQSWIVGTFSAALTANMSGFAVLWAVPYMMRAQDLERPIAAASVSLIMVGWAVGSPIVGWVSDTMRRRKPAMALSAIGASAGFATLVYLPGLPLVAAQALLFAIGFFACAMHLGFVAGSENNSPAAAGTAMALVNTLIMASGAAFQPLIGWLLDLSWDGRMEAGARIYSLESFQFALLPLLISNLTGILVVFLVRETRCRNIHRGP